MDNEPDWSKISNLSEPVSGVSADQKNGRSIRKRNFEKANNEYRTRNVEYRSKAFYLFLLKRLSKAKPDFEILRFDIRDSAVRCSNIM